MCALGVSISRRPTSGPYRTAAPGLTVPIKTKGGGVCACEASAGGRVSRVGARFTQVRTAQLPEGAARSVKWILPPAAHNCVHAPPNVRGCQDNQPRAQRRPSAILGVCHVTRAQRHTTVFNAHSRPVRKADFSAENQDLSPPSRRKPENTLRGVRFPPSPQVVPELR